MVQCDVNVFCEDEFVMTLGAGMAAVCKFAKLADEGIDGVISVESSFASNRDVIIGGKKMIEFIDKEYSKYSENAHRLIRGEKVYKIVCYDMS